MKRAHLVIVLTFCSLRLDARTMRVVWHASGAPAASLEASFGGSAARTDRNGTIAIPEGAENVTITDPISRLRLFRGPVADLVEVPEPVRVRGRVAGAGGAVRAFAGEGSDADGERSALGLALPPKPARWQKATVDDRRFDTGWMKAETAFLVAAADVAGNAGTMLVALPHALRPRQTIDAGTIRLMPTREARFELAMPADETATSVSLHVTSASWPAPPDAAVARHLRALEALDPPMYRLLVLGHPYGFSRHGTARLRMLPPASSLSVVVREAFGHGRAERNVVLGGPPLRLTFADLGAHRSARTITGVVTLEGKGTAVGGATVVLSDPPRRRETVTTADGRFAFAGVNAPEPMTFFVDARGRVPRTHRATAIFRASPHSDVPLTLPANPPEASTAAPSNVPEICQIDDQYPFIFPVAVPQNATYFISVNYQTNAVVVTATKPGTYQFHIYANPFLFYTASVDVVSAAPAVGVLNGSASQTATVAVFNSSNFPLPAGTALYFAPPSDLAPWLDPTVVDLATDANGSSSYTIPCINNAQVYLYINDGSAANNGQGNGCDGAITLQSNCNITLPGDPTTPCTCTQ